MMQEKPLQELRKARGLSQKIPSYSRSLRKFDPMGIGHDLLRRLLNPRDQRKDTGWAGRSLEGSLSGTFLISMAIMQGVIGFTAILSLGLVPKAFAVASSHLVAGGVALVVFRFKRGYLLLILGTWVLFAMDWAVSPVVQSLLLFASCWMCNLNAVLPTFLLRGKAAWLAPLSAATALPVLMVVTRPELVANPLVPGVFITTIVITIAARISLSYLLEYTSDVDAETRELEYSTVSLMTSKSATYQAAEDARVLHDTAINTLGAIANGGAAINDLDAVRQRCLADIMTIEILRSASGHDVAVRHGFRDAIRPTGIRVRYTGMSDDELASLEEFLPARVMRTLSRAVAEAVQNAAKHSGAEEAVVSVIRTAEGVRVVVSDQGGGIQQGRHHGAGIKRSILERARQAGVHATINSMLGKGTVVTLDYAFDANMDQSHVVDASSSNVANLVRQLRSRTAFVLSASLVGVGCTLSALNHPGEATPEWLMVAVVAVACWLALRERNRPRLSAWTTTVLIVSGPIAFLMSAWAVGFGRTNPFLWQAIAPTGPLLALMIVLLPRTVKLLGFGAYLITVCLTAASVAPISLEAAYITLTAGLLGVGLMLGVTSFVRGLTLVATRTISEQREAFAIELDLAAVEAAAETRRRWRDAGLEESLSLLRAIGEGLVDPRDSVIQSRCAEEEAYLRQITLLNPDLIQMGIWFFRALKRSRLRGVGLTVRVGTVDATAEDAPQFGELLLMVIDAMPQGTKLTIAFFATTKGLAMTLVAPTPHLVSVLSGAGYPKNGLKLQTLGEQDFAELVITGRQS